MLTRPSAIAHGAFRVSIGRAFRWAAAVGLAVGVLAVPHVARACAVCSAGRDDENQTAFLISTIFLSLLPLAALGTFVFVLWRRFRRLDAESAPSGDATSAALLSAAPRGATERA